MTRSTSLAWTAALLVSLASACSAREGSPPPLPVATVALPEPTPAPAAAWTSVPSDSAAQPAAPKPTAVPQAAWQPGQAVTARGTISTTPWQHLVGFVAGKVPDYFDLAEGGQTVIYVSKAVRCPGLVEVEATVVEVRGASKRPGGPASKVDESYVELHLDVLRHRCVR